MNHFLRAIFFLYIVRPLVRIVLGLNVRHRERLPITGPAVVVANHNSHLDTMVLMTLFPRHVLRKLRPVAAVDYFLRNRFIAWFSLRIIGIIPLKRKVEGYHNDPLEPISEALARGEIVLLFPEGSRGEGDEHLHALKTGIAHIARRHPNIAVHPVYLHGLGKVLPKGEALLVPLFCDVFAGEPMTWESAGAAKEAFMEKLGAAMTRLAAEGNFAQE